MKRFMSLRFRPALGATIAFAMILPVGFSADAGAQCVGDCDDNNQVLISEVQRCVNLNSSLPTEPCANADQNGDGTVDENEVDLCIQSFLDEDNCPMVFTPTEEPTQEASPTPTITPTASHTATVVPPTSTHTPTATNTASPTATPTNTPTATNTPTMTPTRTNTVAPTNTPLGARMCTFTTGSRLTLRTEAFPIPPLPTGGSLNIDCGSVGAMGKAECTCTINTFNPVNITGIGTVCISGEGSCAAGEIDCDGGNVLDWDTQSDHNIGACTSNADCATKCAAACAPAGVTDSGCENFCEGGAKDNLACTDDTDCPDGACNGPDGGSHGNVCGCQCLSQTGAASSAGDMSCQLPTKIYVVLPAGSPCSNPATINLPPVCIPLTTAEAAGTVAHANNGMGTFGNSGSGTPFNCAAANYVSGGKLAGVVNFYDSTLGDLSVLNEAVCQ